MLFTLKEYKTEVILLRAQYIHWQLPNDNGIELLNGTKIKLVSSDLGVIIAKQVYKVLIFECYSERLCNYTGTRREFSLPKRNSQSCLDWAVFRGVEHRCWELSLQVKT